MNYQYMICTRGDHESSCDASKEKITRKFKLKDPKFDDYSDPSFFSDWLANMECYCDWYEFSEMTRVLFARRKLVESIKIY